MAIDFYYDVVCPYAYLASTQIEAMARRCGTTVRWRPILLGGLLREVGGPDDPNTRIGPAKREVMRRDRAGWAAMYGVPLRETSRHPQRTVEAMRLAIAAPPGPVRRAVSEALFRAYWVEGRDVTDRAWLRAVAERHGLEPAVFEAEPARAGLREATATAASAGAFGVPSFVAEGRLWWGQDRMSLLERALGSEPPRPSGTSGTSVPGGPGGTGGTSVSGEPVRLTVFHDFASPFSYLAATQVERVAGARGVAVQWAPILLGALFRQLGTPDVPLFEMNPTKRAYVRRDLDDWARHWGVPLHFPEHFPLRSVLPLRVALVEPRATGPIYRAVWVDGRRVDEAEGLGPVLEAEGLPARSLLERAGHTEVKLQLRANTERARAGGVCGVPSFEVVRGGDSVLLWGQDRLDPLGAVLDGRWPTTIA